MNYVIGYNNPTASITIPEIYDGSSFTLTSPENEIYTFSASESVIYIDDGNATASVEIISINDHDRFTISADGDAHITVINGNTPEDCGNEYFIGWDDSCW